MKTWLARLWLGRRADAALARARTDLGARPVAAVVAARVAAPLGRARPWTLRGIARALAARLAAEGETQPCLPRAIALLGEARRCGVAARLVLGVRRDAPPVAGAGLAGPIASHAWLEVDGRAFLEDPRTPDRYEVIARLP